MPGASLGHAAISDGAVDAAILHGCGHAGLAELRNAIAYSVATRCAVVFDLAAEAGVGREVVECGQTLLAHTMALPFDNAVIRLDDPSLRTWLADAERSLARAGAGGWRRPWPFSVGSCSPMSARPSSAL